ncbi:MAG: response regulator, partial [Alphaproteobacteria bacterium]
MQPYVLIVEDEPGIVELLAYNLSAAGFETGVARDGDEAELALAERVPDAVLLDWMLPGVSGIELCRRIRRRPATRDLPIIMLTARSEETDRVRGLDSGADDYVTKPFSPTEMIARLRAVLRRSRPATAAERLEYSDVAIDLVAHRVERAGRNIHLGPTEFRL